MPQMRLDKLLSHLNCGSRKEVQALIRVMIRLEECNLL